ncbi:competence/damage-inducible protein A [Virgibacillus byunsanensis]|uniref:Putative competence-damage inducible protein n=1 Tax=Virgibacillus byunsanensis TaxID=570945 RepID=A0ABW3LKV5_9BACI
MKQFKTEIIAVGTELLLGQIANTNAQWISKELALYGINVFYHGVVGDNLKRVEDTFVQAQERSDVIIVTGGLGPTDDDLTREAFQRLSNLEIIEHNLSMEKIEAYFQKQQTKMTPNNRKQARIFKDSDVIENEVGMAPGMILSYQDKTWVFLPGVPKEMKHMLSQKVLPYLKTLSGEDTIIKSTMLKFIGIGEAHLEDELSDIIHQQSNPTIAPLAQNEGVAIRLTAKASSPKEAEELIDQAKIEILKRVGSFCYGVDDQKLEEKVFQLLKQQELHLAAAESFTGGMFTEKLISIPGASEVCRGGIVCYDKKVKTDVLNISTETIFEYGTVSKECAKEMAINSCHVMDADLGISFTGVAGPKEEEGKPVGTVFIAIHRKNKDTVVENYSFFGDRQTIRRRAILKGYELLYNYLK